MDDAASGRDAPREDAGHSVDFLLGGRVRLRQPRRGFRAGVDAVLLAAACPARAGERALDLGCGAGAAALCLGARAPGLELHGLEIQPAYAALARENAAANGLSLTAHEGDVAAPPPALRALLFDHAILNPPFFEAAGSGSPEAGRDRARREGAAGLEVWADAALRRLRQGGRLTAILPAGSLPRFLAALAGRAGEASILPLSAREGRAARRVIVSARKDRAGPARLGWPFVLHEGAAHEADREDWTPAAAAVLRDARPLALP